MKEHKTNRLIICLIICAILVLIPLTGVVADAAIRAEDVKADSNANSTIDSNVGDNTGANLDTDVNPDLDTDTDNNIDSNPDVDDDNDSTVEGGENQDPSVNPDNGDDDNTEVNPDNGDDDNGEVNPDNGDDNNAEVNPDEGDDDNGEVNPDEGDDGENTPDVAPDNGNVDSDDDHHQSGNVGSDDKIEEVKPSTNYMIGKTLSFETGVEMIVYLNASALMGMGEISIEVVKPIFDKDGAVISEKTTMVTEYKNSKIAGKDAYRFVYADIRADEFATEVTINVLADGEVIQSTVYSVKMYVQSQLAKSTIPANMKSFLVDMVNYGAAAQNYFDYNTSNLANADLTPEQQAYATKDLPEVESVYNVVAGADNLVTTGGVALSLMNTIEANIYVYLNDCNQEDIYAVLEYQDAFSDEIKEMVVDGNDFKYLLNNKYSIVFDEYTPMQMGDAFTVRFFAKDTDAQIGETMTYSIHSYVVRAMEKDDIDPELRAVLEAMIKYGASAKAYFA